jgi:hypothetical protein
MSVKTVAAFLAGALTATTGTAAAVTTGHVFRLQEGDHARYGTIQCNALYALSYSGFDCIGARGYEVVYAPNELRVLRVLRSNGKRVSKTVFLVDPSGG